MPHKLLCAYKRISFLMLLDAEILIFCFIGNQRGIILTDDGTHLLGKQRIF